MEPRELTSADFAEKISQATGLLISYKPSCPHCKNMKKVIEKAWKTIGPVDYLALDTEANPDAMKALEIERVPTLLVIKGGKVKARKPGLMNPRELAAFYKTA